MLLKFYLLAGSAFSIFVLCGMGPYLAFGPSTKGKGISDIGLCAAFGCGLLGCVATFIFYFEMRPYWTVVTALVLSAALSGLAVVKQRVPIRQIGSALFAGFWPDADLLVAVLILAPVVFSSGFMGGFAQPFRIGIDQVGYGITADYLERGGTRSELQSQLIKATGQPDLTGAYKANTTALSFNVSIASEFLLKAHRFGYPMVLAAFSQLLRLRPIIIYQFSILAAPWAIGIFIMLWLMDDVLGLPRPLAKATAIAFGLNCNLLNVLFEGQHSQVFVTPLFILFFGLLYTARKTERQSTAPGWYLASAFVSASIFSLYSDSFIALTICGTLLLVSDVLARDWSSARKTFLFAGLIVLGMVALEPYFYDWVSFILRHLANVSSGHGGAPQPHWAFPSEILGYSSMYSPPSPQALDRSGPDLLFQLLLSLFAINLVFESKLFRDGASFRFWLSPIAVCLMVFFDLRFVHDFHSYSYMKTYTMLLCPLMAFYVVSLFGSLSSLAPSKRFGPSSEILACAMVMIIALVGFQDCVAFSRESSRVPTDAEALRKQQSALKLPSYAILTYPEGGVGCATVAGYVDFNWLNISWSDKYLKDSQSLPVAVLVFRDALPAFKRLSTDSSLLFRGNDMLLIDTGKTVADLHLPDLEVAAANPDSKSVRPNTQIEGMTSFLKSFLADKIKEANNRN